MKEPKILDYTLLAILALIWSSLSGFNTSSAVFWRLVGPWSIALLQLFVPAAAASGRSRTPQTGLDVNACY